VPGLMTAFVMEPGMRLPCPEQGYCFVHSLVFDTNATDLEGRISGGAAGLSSCDAG